MDNKKLITNFEREILFQIVFRMHQKRMSVERARDVSREVLKIIKNRTSDADFSQKMGKLCERYPEVMDAYIATYKEDENEVRKTNIMNVLESLKMQEVRGGE